MKPMSSEKASTKARSKTDHQPDKPSKSLSLKDLKGFANKMAMEANRAPLIHFPQGKLALPDKQDKHVERDRHDLANIVALPVIVAAAIVQLLSANEMAFKLLFWMVLAYFFIDFAWVIWIPSCVKSTYTIKMHHTAALLYLVVPYVYPEYGHFLGKCMLLEANTWFLIARRYFGRIRWHSVGFYVTWITIRLGLFTYLFYEACHVYYERVVVQLDSDKNGTLSVGELLFLPKYVHLTMLAPMLQALFCGLNYKWTYDLVNQKMKSKGPSSGL